MLIRKVKYIRFYISNASVTNLAYTLSKQTNLTFPATLILGGAVQNMPFFFSLLWAYIVPTVIAAGKAGGTTIVIISKLLKRTVSRLA